jgi:transposase
METKGIGAKRGVPQKHYSETFKKMVVREYEQGTFNKDALQKKYQIGGRSRVLTWCRKYGKLHYPQKGVIIIRPMKDPQKRRIKELERLLAEEKLKVSEEKLKVIAYRKLIEIAEREEGISITKKGAAKRSRN